MGVGARHRPVLDPGLISTGAAGAPVGPLVTDLGCGQASGDGVSVDEGTEGPQCEQLATVPAAPLTPSSSTQQGVLDPPPEPQAQELQPIPIPLPLPM